MKTKTNKRNCKTKGDGRRDEILKRFESGNSLYVLRGRRAMIYKLLDAGFASADDVYAAVQLPDDVDPRCLGAVPRGLVNAGIVRSAGFVKSKRTERNASYIQKWALVDKVAARNWLRDNPDIPDPAPDPTKNAKQLQLPGVEV